MTSYKNYRNQYRKNSITKEDQFAMPQHLTTAKELDEKRREKLIDWITYYRRNPHRFVEDYFQIKLYFYQRIWIYLMGNKEMFCAVASRASSKTWLVAVYACVRAVLYPNSEIVVCASTKAQAGILIEDKIKMLSLDYPNLGREISNIVSNLNNWKVTFQNGSVIYVVATRDSARGKRANLLIFEEFRLTDKDIVDSVLRPFKIVRQTPYMKKPEYSGSEYLEEAREIFISSAYYKQFWWYEETKKIIKAMLRGESAGFISFDVRLAIHHKIKTLKQIKSEIDKMDEQIAQLEYYNVPIGENSQAFFSLKNFTRSRSISKAFYPQKIENYNSKKNPYGIQKVEGELRVLVCDLAQRAGAKNDLSINLCMRLIPTNKGYKREVVYLESFSGVNSVKQALRIKQVFVDFEADYIVLDVGAGGGGIPVYDMLGQVTRDDERDCEYAPYTIIPHESYDESTYEELRQRTLGINPIPVIYCFSATAKLNSVIAIDLKDKLQKKQIEFLLDETRMEKYLIKNFPEYMKNHDDISLKAFFSHPYVQTSLLINEAVSLEAQYSGENVKLVTSSSSARKDRIVTLMMGSYFASFLDAKLLRDNDGISDWESLLNVTMMN